jgi:predicted nuclease of predicted toxin-antitoxin system
MARLYADENFPLPIVELLRNAGHNVLTTEDAGNSGLGIPDEDVLEFAVREERTVLTRNWDDFRRLHRSQPDHFGIIICKEDLNIERQATLIIEAILSEGNLRNKLIRIIRPPKTN